MLQNAMDFGATFKVIVELLKDLNCPKNCKTKNTFIAPSMHPNGCGYV